MGGVSYPVNSFDFGHIGNSVCSMFIFVGFHFSLENKAGGAGQINSHYITLNLDLTQLVFTLAASFNR